MGSKRFTVLIMSDPFRTKTSWSGFDDDQYIQRHQGDGAEATHHVGICRQARRVREHLVLRDDAHL